MFETLRLAGLFNREIAMDRTSTAYLQAVEGLDQNANTAMAHMWLVTRTNTRMDQINAGRDWLRLNLAATEIGIGTQPMSQCLQEFPEMEGLYRQVHAMLASDGGTVQMLARLGYGAAVPPSPRWPLSAKIERA